MSVSKNQVTKSGRAREPSPERQSPPQSKDEAKVEASARVTNRVLFPFPRSADARPDASISSSTHTLWVSTNSPHWCNEWMSPALRTSTSSFLRPARLVWVNRVLLTSSGPPDPPSHTAHSKRDTPRFPTHWAWARYCSETWWVSSPERIEVCRRLHRGQASLIRAFIPARADTTAFPWRLLRPSREMDAAISVLSESRSLK